MALAVRSSGLSISNPSARCSCLRIATVDSSSTLPACGVAAAAAGKATVRPKGHPGGEKWKMCAEPALLLR